MSAHGIELAVRALDGRCLTYGECADLAGLCYRPLDEVELLTDKKVKLITSAKAGQAPRDARGAVEDNTAKKRLFYIAAYLQFFREAFLDEHIRSSSTRSELAESYARTQKRLTDEIRGTKQNHHVNIRSLPSAKFLEIIRVVVVEPERIFLTASGKVSSTLYRDRAMVLLACECLRPGAIANIARDDFRPSGGYLNIKDHRKKRQGRTTTGTPVLKLGQSTSVNSASETMITLYPFTVSAIQDYIREEREPILTKRLRNLSRGFLFLSQNGGPIGHRSSLTTMFHELGEQLRELDFLSVGDDPYFHDKAQYDFYGYVLRHSAASLFVESKGTSDATLDEMRIRFGWTALSKMPQRYADRALSDKANIDLMDFNQSLLEASRRGNSK
ncbi:hypothetical protein [Roseateles sp.]|uniref:hypothetical protein n=1 Tax=Roseateles sp. TaxID=1971397 RepID=UPI003D1075E8